jgi:glycosyltransferase involved in cell wall biosynthesis
MERYTAELAARLCLEHDVHLFTCEASDVPLGRLTVHPVHVRQKPFLALFAQFYRQTSRMIRLRDFDIVHTIGGITAHQNVVTAQYCQYAWGDAIRREPGAKAGLTPYHQFMWRMAGYFEHRAFTSPETLGISANSRRTEADLVKFYGADRAKMQVIYNGVDTHRFSPANVRFRHEIRQRYQISDDALVVLFVGEYRRKGLAAIVDALGNLGDHRLHLLAVGRGDLAHYRSLAEAAGIADRATFAGPAQNIEQVFGAADLFVFPTYYEPFGMVITEAMASGLPVITSRSAGAAELIADGESGLLLDSPSDPAELSEKIAALVSDRAALKDMGRRARPAASGYTWDNVAEDTLSLYTQSLAGTQPASVESVSKR